MDSHPGVDRMWKFQKNLTEMGKCSKFQILSTSGPSG